jgi:cell division protein FtsB
MRILLVILLILLLGLQYRLWVGQGSLANAEQLEDRISIQEAENAELEARNEVLYAEIDELNNGTEAVEEHARTELGMVREGETFYLIVDEEKESLEQ